MPGMDAPLWRAKCPHCGIHLVPAGLRTHIVVEHPNVANPPKLIRVNCPHPGCRSRMVPENVSVHMETKHPDADQPPSTPGFAPPTPEAVHAEMADEPLSDDASRAARNPCAPSSCSGQPPHAAPSLASLSLPPLESHRVSASVSQLHSTPSARVMQTPSFTPNVTVPRPPSPMVVDEFPPLDDGMLVDPFVLDDRDITPPPEVAQSPPDPEVSVDVCSLHIARTAVLGPPACYPLQAEPSPSEWLPAPTDPPPLTPATSHIRAPHPAAGPAPRELFPDEDSVLNDVALAPHGLIVNKRHRLLICTKCGCAIAPKHLPSHFKAHHRGDLKSEEALCIAQHVRDMYEIPDQPELPSPSHQPIPAVYGLHVTPEPYVFCAGCAHGFKNLKTLRLHKCTMEAPPSASSTHHYAQTLFNHPKCFIAVAIPEANNRTPLSYRLRQLLRDARDHLSAPPAATTPITAPTHTDAAMAFIRQEQWDKEVLGLNPVQVSEWVSLDENHPILSKMRPVCASYLGKIHALLLSAPDPIKTALARFNETAHNSHSFYAIKSLNAYSCTLTKFVSFVIRAHLDLLGGQPVRLSSEQRAACASLVTALQSHDDRSESEDHLQSLMWLLVSAKRGQYALDMHYTPFFHYSIYSSLQRNGQFHRASVIGHNNAQLMFAARAAVFYHVHLIGKSTDGDFLGIFQHYRHLVSNSTDCPFSYLAGVAVRTRAIRGKEESLPIVQFVDKAGTRANVSGSVLGLTDIGTGVKDILGEYRDIVEDRALLGKFTIDDPVFAFPEDLSEWQNDATNDDPFYGLFTDIRNPALALQHTLYDLLTSHGAYYGRFVVPNSTDLDDALQWHMHAVISFLRAAEDAEGRLFSAIHLSSGQPARGTEYLPLHLVNATAGATRSVHLQFCFLLFLSGYNKTSCHGGHDRAIVRTPPPAVVKVFMFHMIFIRPTQVIFAGLLSGKASSLALRMRTLIFPGFDRPLESDDLGDALQQDTGTHLGVPFRLRTWRHLATCFTNVHTAVLPGVDPEDAIEDAQRGHSSHTARRVYDRSNHSVSGSTQYSIRDYISCSISWHKLIGMGEPSEARTALSYLQHPDAAAPLLSIGVDQLSEKLAGLVSPSLATAVENAVSAAFHSIFDKIPEPAIAPHPVSRRLTSATLTLPAPISLLPAFRQFLCDPHASFKSPEQAQFLTHLLDGKRNILACFPTGYGKTLLMLVPPAMYERNKVTIIITPLDGLQPDLQRRCKEHHLGYSVWTLDTRHTPRTPVVFAAVESASTHSFLEYITTLQSDGTLSRIIFEEAHVIIAHKHFRACMNYLRDVRLAAVPFVFLSATFPTVLEPELAAVFGISTHVTIRIPSSRPELAYRVLLFTTEAELRNQLRVHVASLLSRYLRGERLMIFCRSVKEVQSVSTALNLPCYYASLPVGVRLELYERFASGEAPAIVSTTSLGNGVDICNVRDVIHVGPPYDLTSFSQESGRAGRDKQHSRSTVYVSFDWQPPQGAPTLEPDLFGAEAMMQWLANKNQCRRLALSLFFDGAGVTCVELPNPNLCDVCVKAESALPFLPHSGSHLIPGRITASDFTGLCPPSASHGAAEVVREAHAYKARQQAVVDAMKPIASALRSIRHSCASCYVLGQRDFSAHTISECPRLTSRGFQQFKIAFRLPKGICWHCTLPQGRGLHGNNHGDAQCADGGQIHAALYTATLDAELQRVLRESLPGSASLPQDPSQWPDWFAQSAHPLANHLQAANILLQRAFLFFKD